MNAMPPTNPAPHRIISLRDDHARDTVGMTYVYPVVSRRARGVSVGINLNPNRACNWRCVYCQVPGLVRGSAPAIDLSCLRQELTTLLQHVCSYGAAPLSCCTAVHYNCLCRILNTVVLYCCTAVLLYCPASP